jgi:ATP-dependent protease ClpP protease subunit
MKSKLNVRAGANLLELDLLGEIGFFINAEAVGYALKQHANSPVLIRINSPGGDFAEGMAIYNLLRQHGQPITTINMAITGSAATLIFMAGDTRVMEQGSALMVHRARVYASFADQDELVKLADVARLLDQNQIDILAARSGQDAKVVAEQVTAETWFSAQEAVDAGYATEVGEGFAVAAHADLSRVPERLRANLLIGEQGSMDIRTTLGLKADATDADIEAALKHLLANQSTPPGNPQTEAPPKKSDETQPSKPGGKPADKPSDAPEADPKQPDVKELVAAAVADAFAAREAAHALSQQAQDPLATREELHAAACTAAVERFIGEGKVTPAQRTDAIKACGSTSASLSATISYWEKAPRVVAKAQKLTTTESSEPVLTEWQKVICEQSGMKPKDFIDQYNKVTSQRN